ncbi:MAG TPA: GyrI-like domain-containing protein [Spirochaetota bacterium]|nr:GyrI-like domain-containing protein [Spirochaetota bacterium]
MKKIFYFLLIIILIIGGVLVYSGLFKEISVSEKEIPSMYFVYQKHIGPYKETGKVMEDVYSFLEEKKIASSAGIGIYYDNPENTEDSKLRSVCGCIVTEEAADQIENMESGYSVSEYPGGPSVYSEFPYKNIVSISIMLGIQKVYPKIQSYVKEKEYQKAPMVGIYDKTAGIIKYISPLDIRYKYFEELLEEE